jgi:hypothetical protein
MCQWLRQKKTSWCEEFSTAYQKVCRQTNIKLAVDCPNKEKHSRTK